MKIICLGSLNLDHVYRLPHALRTGETMTSLEYRLGAGGKGGNQSIAAARAGAKTLHAGIIGNDGLFLKENLEASGVDTSLVDVRNTPSGHAIVLVNDQGDNSIVLYPGTNRQIDDAFLDRLFQHTEPGDILLLQNETNHLPEAMFRARKQGLRIAFNFAPFEAGLQLPLHLVDYLFLNEIEAEGLSGQTRIPDMIEALKKQFPQTLPVITAGGDGAYCGTTHIPSPKVTVVDTTAAGDTFIGYFLAATLENVPPANAATLACHAASICVSRPGAASSIPYRHELS